MCHYTHLQPTSMVNFYIASDLKSAGVCRLTAAVQPLLYYISFTFGFQKGSRFTELVNQGYKITFRPISMKNWIITVLYTLITRRASATDFFSTSGRWDTSIPSGINISPWSTAAGLTPSERARRLLSSLWTWLELSPYLASEWRHPFWCS